MVDKMIFCLTIIDLSFVVFDYKKKVQIKKRKKNEEEDKKIRIELEHAKRT